MKTIQIECSCGWSGETTVPEDQVNNVLWECNYCVKRNVWQGPEGPQAITGPEHSSDVTPVYDADEAIGATNVN